MKENLRGSELYDRLYEYKYNEQGVCIEIIKYGPGYEMHYYYDDMGNPIKVEYISDDDNYSWSSDEYYY